MVIDDLLYKVIDDLLVSTYDNYFSSELHNIEQMPFKAGSLQNALSVWQQITTDPIILLAIKGMTIDFIGDPSTLRNKPQICFNQSEHSIVQKEIQNLLEKQVIEMVDHCPQEVISNILLEGRKTLKNIG